MNAEAETEKKEESNILIGIPASSGIVIGKAYVLDRYMICVLQRDIPYEETDDEIERFRGAVEQLQTEMMELSERAIEEFGDDIPVLIFDAHTQILKDPTMIRDVETIIAEKKCNAEWALKVLLERYQERFSKIRDPYFRERLIDIEQVFTRIQRHLTRGEEKSLTSLTDPVIVIAHDLSPVDTIQMDTRKVIGFATDVGGKTSHAGIIASSMDIPAVVGLKSLSTRVRSGDPIILDGSTGEVVHLPNKEQFLKYTRRRQKYLYYDRELHAQKHLQAKTQDGINIKVLANIESSNDLKHLHEHGAEGVGLYRTEYLYIHKVRWPDEEEQFEDYKIVAESVRPHYAVIRTLDLGGDKLATNMEYYEPESNPALGLRAIRYCLNNPLVFKTQLRAILRASAFGNLKIMYPLITTVDELLEANRLLDEARHELREKGVAYDENLKVGIMIETPASVLVADDLAKHCSFFSIGTNDLIQYTMAIDRVNERVAYLYQPLSPAIVRMLSHTVKAADKAGISVSVCGKMAGDPVTVILLLGLGNVRELSMDVHSIPRIKKFIRSITVKDASEIVEAALGMSSTEEIKTHISGKIRGLIEDGVNANHD